MATSPQKRSNKRKPTRKRRQSRRVQLAIQSVVAIVIVAVGVVLFREINLSQQDGVPESNFTAVPTATQPPYAADTPAFTATPTSTPLYTAVPLPTATPIPTQTPVPTETPVPTPAPTPVDLEYPYFIEVDKSKQVVTVYTIGEDGYYDLVVKEFICSTGHCDKIEDGMYTIGEKYRWKQMENESYVQYASRISGPYLFHSGCYYTAKPNQLKHRYYDKLGTNVSSGCIRLTVGDALWIYTNCPTGTPIHVMTGGVRDEELLERLTPPTRTGNWDPTDPDPKNPYYVTPAPETTPDPTPALGVTPAPTPAWTVHPKLKSWGYC